MKCCFKQLTNSFAMLLALLSVDFTSINAAAACDSPIIPRPGIHFRSLAPDISSGDADKPEVIEFEVFKKKFLQRRNVTPEEVDTFFIVKTIAETGDVIAIVNFAEVIASGEILGREVTAIGRDNIPELINKLLQSFLLDHPEVQSLEVVLPIYCEFRFPLCLYSLTLSRLIISSQYRDSRVFIAHSPKEISEVTQAHFPKLKLPSLTHLAYPHGITKPSILAPAPRMTSVYEYGILELMAGRRSPSTDSDSGGYSGDKSE